MLIIDDILLAPLRGVIWVAEKIQKAVEENLEAQKVSLTAELSELYMQLDTGKITQEEFDTREKELLDRLDTVKAQMAEARGGARESERR